MVRIAIGAARHKIAQFHRDRERMPDISDVDADRLESRSTHNPHSGERVFERIAAREDTDRLLLGMLKLPERCRELLRLKLLEQRSYDEIRGITGISGNIYEMTARCFRTLLRHLGGSLLMKPPRRFRSRGASAGLHRERADAGRRAGAL